MKCIRKKKKKKPILPYREEIKHQIGSLPWKDTDFQELANALW